MTGSNPHSAHRNGDGEEERHPRPSVEYNLEKDPLQTGHVAPRTDPATKAAMSADEWTVRRRMAGWIAIIIIVILLAVGAIVAFDAHRLFFRLWQVE